MGTPAKASRDVTVVPTGAALGAEVAGADLRALDGDTFQFIRRAWLAYQVIVLRGQRLDDDALIAFSRRFGELDEAPVQENGRRFVEGHPEIYVVSNVLERGVPIGSLGSGEAVWHTDMSYVPRPPKASILYALEVPPSGGETSFCSTTAAWDTLSTDLRARIVGLRVKHDGTYNSGGYVREGVNISDDPRTAAGVFHPLVCLHPETGRRSLYLGRRRNAYIEDLALDESEALLDILWTHATRPELAWEHSWRPGDIVLWDNRSTMNRRKAFDPEARRVLHRTQIRADSVPRTG
ncbi:MAG TPA: TauD/TfdA family dioxygenase [Polyangiaceae bacterium]|nr:TauD/TfdA family dioxygenase [Polyangiaceae bacterium]